MGTHTRVAELRARLKSEGGDVSGRHVRASWTLPAFATFVTFAFLSAALAPPYTSQTASALMAPAPVDRTDLQYLDVAGDYTTGVSRDAFSITDPPPPPPPVATVPAAGVPDPGTAQAIAYEMLLAMGMGDHEFSCLVALWNRESGWNVYAMNPTSGAYGIPQAYPGNKMASVGADWQTNPATQITWGLQYIMGRWGSPCGAWAQSENEGWY